VSRDQGDAKECEKRSSIGYGSSDQGRVMAGTLLGDVNGDGLRDGARGPAHINAGDFAS
jgi:hypothetical protein